MISPFTAELKNPAWIDEVIAAAGRTRDEVDVKVIVVTLSDMDLQKQRIIERGTDRDRWKLDHWDRFQTRVRFVPEINWNLPSTSVMIFDNSGELTEEKIESLLRFIQS
jgi:hypothetical protein